MTWEDFLNRQEWLNLAWWIVWGEGQDHEQDRA